MDSKPAMSLRSTYIFFVILTETIVVSPLNTFLAIKILPLPLTGKIILGPNLDKIVVA
jgi:hypothetical protein